MPEDPKFKDTDDAEFADTDDAMWDKAYDIVPPISVTLTASKPGGTITASKPGGTITAYSLDS